MKSADPIPEADGEGDCVSTDARTPRPCSERAGSGAVDCDVAAAPGRFR